MRINSLTKYLAVSSLITGLLAFVLTIGDVLALHDIAHDYVSQRILTYLDITLSQELPAWTATTGEWALVQLSLVVRGGFFFLNTITLVFLLRVLKRAEASARRGHVGA